jgi:hypothetical protein
VFFAEVERGDAMKKIIVGLIAALAVVNLLAVSPAPWARWMPDSSVTADGTGSASLPDATGGGHSLTFGAGFNPLSGDMRGVVFSGIAVGGTYGKFNCPALRSRAFALWIKPDSGQHTYAQSDLACLLNGFSGMTVYSVKTQSEWRVAFGTKLANGQMYETMTDLPVRSSATVHAHRGIWQHLLFSLEDTGAEDSSGKRICNLSIYRNGELVSHQDGIAVPSANAGTAVIANTDSMTTSPVKGYFDDIRVWTNALSAAEAKSVYEETRVCRLIGHWTMDRIDESDGVRTTPDVSGNGSHMKLGTCVSVTNGVSGLGALFFDGRDETGGADNDSWGLVTNPLSAPYQGDTTVAMWVKRDRAQNTPRAARLFMMRNDSVWISYGANSPDSTEIGDSILSGSGSISSATGRAEEWSHLVFVFHFDSMTNASGEVALRGQTCLYRNGELLRKGAPTDANASLYMSDLSKPGARFLLANYTAYTRPFRGTIDDLYWYAGRLTDDEIRTLYRGPAKVSAGEDFAVAAPSATLYAEFQATPANPAASGYAGRPVWTLVSAPPGGEGAEIENPNCAVTSVTLPVTGEYTFAVSNEVFGVVCADDVRVTRLASAASAVPSVTAAVGSTTGLCAVVEATASAGARVRWMKMSGPGAVWFGYANSPKTVATFGAAGTYALKCIAETDGGTASATVSVTVSGPTIADTLDGGLGVYWPFKLEEYGEYCDVKRGYKLVGNGSYESGVGTLVVPGVACGYGVSIGTKPDRCLVAQSSTAKYLAFDEYLTSDTSANGTPKEPYNTISCWLYHDGSDTNTVWMGTVCVANYTCAIHYLCDNGAANDFSIVQNKSNGTPLRFRGPAGLNYTNRWIHLVAQMDNHGTGGSEVWVNGMKLTETTGATLGLGRTTSNAFVFGGGSAYPYPPNDSNASIAGVTCKKFPGAIDELRMYRRKLSEAEIRYLYEHPVPSAENEAPSVTVPLSTVKLYRNLAGKQLAAGAFDDAIPAGSALACAWSVAAGDASGLLLTPGEGASLMVTGLKNGDYKLQLVATDGERTTYSALVPIKVISPGMRISIK